MEARRLDDKNNQDYDHYQPKAAAGIITPVSAVRPSRKSSDDEQQKQDERDRAEHGRITPRL